ncbi:cupredoxin domain-containing protein [Mucilaginibacter sp. AW1-3]
MKKNILNLLLLIVTVAIVIYSCSKSSNQPSTDTTGGSTATGASVAIQNFAFVPDTIRIKVGQSVTWKNMDTAPHTATALNGAFGSADLSTNQTFQFIFNTAGTFSYHCTVHPMMATAYVIVTN